MEAILRRFSFKSPMNAHKTVLSTLLTVFAISGIVVKLATPYMAIATIAYGLLICGIMLHAYRKLHITLMSMAVLIDISLVLVLEMKRSAIATAVGHTLTSFQRAHIIFSSLAILFYFPSMGLGIAAALKKSETARPKGHIYLGWIAFFCRTMGFFLMFSLLEHVKTKNLS